MGKKARLKKQLRVEQTLEERALVAARRQQARAPLVRLIRRAVLATIVTIVLLYVGQVVDARIARAINTTEASR